MNVAESTRHNIEDQLMLEVGESVVVAVSGGPDSLCLLHVLMGLRAELGIELHVAHLNHGLRGDEAAADAEYVRGLAAEWGVAATVETADVPAYRRTQRLSLEEAARQVRYAFLTHVAAAVGAVTVATGHTADDQVETILMHWLRGAGLTGLRGMLPVQEWPGGLRVIRPLLEVGRSDIEAYCIANGLRPRRDRSNNDERIWRNRVRRQLLPLLEQLSPGVRASILRTAHILADEDAYMRDQVRSLWPAIAKTATDAVEIDLPAWQAQPVAIQRRIVREAWRQIAASYDDLSWLQVERARDLLSGTGGRTMSLPHGIRLYRSYNTFIVTPDADGGIVENNLPLLDIDMLPLAVPGTTVLPRTAWSVETAILSTSGGASWQTKAGALTEDFDAQVAGENLALRRWQPGDRLQLLGMAGSKKVQDIMVDSHIPRPLRARVPLLVTPERLLWVVGSRRSEWAKVTTATAQILRVSFFNQQAQQGSGPLT